MEASTDIKEVDSIFRILIVLVVDQLDGDSKKTLRSIENQDYPNLELAVVDLSKESGKSNFSAGANLAFGKTDSEEAATDFLLFVDEGIVLEPGAITRLVDEARDFEASVAAPKVTLENDRRRLVEVGVGTDKTGAIVERAFLGELDQGQYDLAESVFGIRRGCLLVRRDLYRVLGGFDEAITHGYRYLDFCWRAHLAGADVLMVPQAVCSLQIDSDQFADTSKTPDHQEDFSGEIPALNPKSQFAFPHYRYQIRAVLSNYGLFHLIRVLPQVLMISVLGMVGNLLRFSPKYTIYILEAWLWNLFRIFSIFKKRNAIKKFRSCPDKDIRNMQERGFAPITLFLRDAGSHFSGYRKFLWSKGTWLAWLGILLVFLFGSRHLITQSVPAIGDFLPFGDLSLSQEWFSSWRSSGLGADGLSPGADFWLAILDSIFFGASALARTVFLLSPFILGSLGIWYLLGQIARSSLAKVLAGIAYLSIPLPYVALARGDLDALVLYAAAPFILSQLLTVKNFITGSLILGLTLGISAAFTFDVFGLLIFLGVGCLLAGFLSGILNFRSLGIAFLGGAIGVLLNFSWGVQLWEWRPESPGEYGITELLIFNVGGIGAGYLVWAFVGSAIVLLLLARGQRSVYMVYAWVLYLGGVVLAWMGEQGWHHIANVEALLIPAALGLAMALGLGAEIYKFDRKPSRESAVVSKPQYEASNSPHKWRWVLISLTGVAFVVGTFPVLVLSFDGRWDLPKNDYQTTLEFVDDNSQRVVWLGHPDILGPGSWQLNSDLSYAVTLGTTPSIAKKWVHPRDKELQLLEEELGKLNTTNRLGSQLALFGISHIILVEKHSSQSSYTIPIDADLLSILEEQFDLQRLDTREGIWIYRNREVVPIKAVLPVDGLSSASLNPALVTEVFEDSNTDQLKGDFYFAEAGDNWVLEVAGKEVKPTPAFEWAKLYSDLDSSASLSYKTPNSYRLLMASQVVLWAVFLFLTAWALRKKALRKNKRIKE